VGPWTTTDKFVIEIRPDGWVSPVGAFEVTNSISNDYVYDYEINN